MEIFLQGIFPSAEAKGKRGSAEVLLFQMVLTGDSVIFQGMRASHP
ncbi:MAG: hypothetical protein HUU43_14615 [Ignavibacteriaceae bacterium]|nr:hypothetical protein [Ignavibacteriaceae bacterium]